MDKMLQLSPEQLISRYDLVLQLDASGNPTGIVHIRNVSLCRADDAQPIIRAAKPEIMAVLLERRAAEERAAEEKAAKIAAIPGLQEIQAAQADLARWQQEWDDSFEGEGGGGVGVREKPEYDLPALCRAYPLAAAYLEAEEFSLSYNYTKASAGRDALDALLDGADPAQTLKSMRAKWAAYVNEHAWD